MLKIAISNGSWNQSFATQTEKALLSSKMLLPRDWTYFANCSGKRKISMGELLVIVDTGVFIASTRRFTIHWRWPFVERRAFKEYPPVFRCKKGISFDRKFFDEFYGTGTRTSTRFQVVFPHDNCVGVSLAETKISLMNVDCGNDSTCIWILRATNVSNIDETKSIDYFTTREPRICCRWWHILEINSNENR